MDALEAIFTRRSVRKYTDEPVSEEDLRTLLEAAMSAPSASNRQPWHFIVVRERARLNAIMDVHPYSKMLKEAPLALVVCGDSDITEKYWVQDCSAATQNILLAARALGLGAVWLGVHTNPEREPPVKQLFELPENIHALCIIAVGHPAEEQGRVDRYQEERIRQESW